MLNSSKSEKVLKTDVFSNIRVKENPLTGEVYEVLVCSKKIFKDKGNIEEKEHCQVSDFELSEEEKRLKENVAYLGGVLLPKGKRTYETSEEKKERIQKSARVSKKKLYDFIICNDFNLFFTLTLDKEKIDRYDYKIIVNKLNRWLDNMVRRKGLKYVITAEKHKDGALHFHGLCNEEACRLIDSGKTTDRDQKIYNIANWKFGFTTAVKTYGDSKEQIASYISKYIVKQYEEGKIGGRYFYHSSNLDEPTVKHRNLDQDLAIEIFEEMKENASDDDITVAKWVGQVPDAGIKFMYVHEKYFDFFLEMEDPRKAQEIFDKRLSLQNQESKPKRSG